MTTKDRILEVLRDTRALVSERFTVTKIGLFGSYARGEATPQSDIDLLVEFAQPTFDNYMDLKFLLEERLNASVDLVLADSIKPRLSEYINREVLYVA